MSYDDAVHKERKIRGKSSTAVVECV